METTTAIQWHKSPNVPRTLLRKNSCFHSTKTKHPNKTHNTTMQLLLNRSLVSTSLQLQRKASQSCIRHLSSARSPFIVNNNKNSGVDHFYHRCSSPSLFQTHASSSSSPFHTYSHLRLANPSTTSTSTTNTTNVSEAKSTSSSNTSHGEQQQQEQQEQTTGGAPKTKLSIKERIRAFIRVYGITGLIVYFAIYYLTWASFYFALEHKWINAGDITALAKKIGLDKWIDLEYDKSKMVANVGDAYLITKLTEPLRFGATIVVTPFVLKMFKKIVRK